MSRTLAYLTHSSPASTVNLQRPETAQQWEAGIKTEFLDGRFSATAAWFHLTKQNIATSHPDPELALRGFLSADWRARNEGVEVDITGELLPGWGYQIKTQLMRITAQLNVHNVSDEKYFENATSFSALYGAPRTFMGMLRIEH
ncbi:MAG: TonB-dependent receptor [Nitrosomonas sp.]